jgi:hypothetical protein
METVPGPLSSLSRVSNGVVSMGGQESPSVAVCVNSQPPEYARPVCNSGTELSHISGCLVVVGW